MNPRPVHPYVVGERTGINESEVEGAQFDYGTPGSVVVLSVKITLLLEIHS